MLIVQSISSVYLSENSGGKWLWTMNINLEIDFDDPRVM